MAEVSFGEWLRRQRKGAGWTQEQLALQLSCSTSALRKMESELRRPSVQIIEQLAEIFHIPQEEQKSFQRFARGDWQAFAGGDIEEAPWRVTRAAHRSNLPASTTSFIGREKEKREIIDLIGKSRLVTLTGAGGIGKTRLSLEVAQQALNIFPDGLWFIELTPLSDPALVPQIITSTLGLIEQANRPAQTVLTDFLQAKKSLLILDNCEHLIQACAQLAETLLRACPDLHILATSREALSIAGETIYLVPSLTTPDPLQSTFDALSQYEAVQLFLERAQSALRDFSLNQENAHAITQVCHHLDGIPLAIELAASRVKLLRVEEIATRLDNRFGLLTKGSRTALPRHQTLQAMIDWSHDLLSEPERVLLRRLSVFAGGWTLEAAEAVCADTAIESQEILDLLTQLVNKSLILSSRGQGQETRYRMLETIRQYAYEKLWAADEGELMRQQHLAYFVDLAERAEPNLRAFDMVMWLDDLDAELDNIRVALEWAQENDIEAQLRIVSALLWFWHIRGHRNEGIDWLERGLSIEATERDDQPPTPKRAMTRGKALNASGFLLSMGVELQKAKSHLEESLYLFQELGPAGKQGMAYALLRLRGAANWKDQERTPFEQILTLFHEIGDKFGMAECLMQLTFQAQRDGNYEQAAIFTEKELALSREIGDKDGMASALWNLADLASAQENYQRAIALIEEAIILYRDVDNKWALGMAHSASGNIFFWQGNYERARKIYEESLALGQEIGDGFIITMSFYSQGFIAWFQGDYVRAAQKITDSLTAFRNIGLGSMAASSLHALGDIALAQEDNKRAVQWYEAEMAFGQEGELHLSQAFAFCGLGKVAWAKGDYELATNRFEQGLSMSQEADFKHGKFHALYGLGRVAQSKGDHAAARAHYEEMLKMQRLRISPLYRGTWLKTYVCAIAYPLAGFAVLTARQNQMDRAACLLGAAESLYSPLRFEMSARERAEHDEAIAAARAALGEEAFAKAWAEGQAMTLEEVVAYALEED